MKVYADAGGRRAWQVATDLLVLAWVVGWVWFARLVHDATAALAAPGRRLETAGDGLADNLRRAADRSDRVPVVGDDLRSPFDGAGAASTAIAEAGRNQQEAVADLALLLAITTFAVPTALVLMVWLPLRVRFVRRATAAQRLIDEGTSLDLFALRALVRQPLGRLAHISADPAGGWRSEDDDVVEALAALELRASGLRSSGGRSSGGRSSGGRTSGGRTSGGRMP